MIITQNRLLRLDSHYGQNRATVRNSEILGMRLSQVRQWVDLIGKISAHWRLVVPNKREWRVIASEERVRCPKIALSCKSGNWGSAVSAAAVGPSGLRAGLLSGFCPLGGNARADCVRNTVGRNPSITWGASWRPNYSPPRLQWRNMVSPHCPTYNRASCPQFPPSK
jgi:hypothetical protein